MQPQLRILEAELVSQIIDEAFQLLVNPGIKVQLKEARTLLADAGARVDEERSNISLCYTFDKYTIQLLNIKFRHYETYYE
jgi:trimethylamine:corrinoid methyltransferase-like protein